MKRGAWASQTTVISSFVCWPCTMPVSRHSCEDPLIPGEREFISVKEAVAMYAIGRDTIYRLIRKGRLPYINIGERLTRISREQLEKMVPLREEPIKDKHLLPRLYDMEPENCYTIGEISKKFRIDDSTVWAHIRKYSIPTRQIGNYVYAPKKEIDNLYKSL